MLNKVQDIESSLSESVGWGCRQNRVIEYSKVAKLGIPSVRAHLGAAFPDGVPLETVFVGPELLQQADAAAEEAVASASWCAPLLPLRRASCKARHPACLALSCAAEVASGTNTTTSHGCFIASRGDLDIISWCCVLAESMGIYIDAQITGPDHRGPASPA